MPRKIASVKNAKPSSANGSPIDSPKRPMKRGHSRPSSNDSTVPDTAPTANRMLVPLASCFDSSRYSGSRVRRCCTSASTISAGSATPAAANTMWNASEIPIWDRAYARAFQSIGTTGFCVERDRHSRSASRRRAWSR